MRGFKKIAVVTIALASIVTPAIAATFERTRPTNLIVWAFLTCCALIIVAQVFPLIRSIIEETEMTAEKARAKKQQEAH